MLTDQDVKKLIEVFATKEDLKDVVINLATKDELKSFQDETQKNFSGVLKEIFTTKEDLENFREEMRKSFSDLLTAVDAYAKKADTYFQEMLMLAQKVDRHERWIQQIADKLGIKLEV